MLVPYHRLPEIFVSARTSGSRDPTRPSIFFVSLNLENSAARTAPLLIGKGGALAALGFQDVIRGDFSEAFFELLYSRLVHLDWNLPQAFQEAWAFVRSDPKNFAATGSGIALWGGTHMLPPHPILRKETAPQAKQRVAAAQVSMDKTVASCCQHTSSCVSNPIKNSTTRSFTTKAHVRAL